MNKEDQNDRDRLLEDYKSELMSRHEFLSKEIRNLNPKFIEYMFSSTIAAERVMLCSVLYQSKTADEQT